PRAPRLDRDGRRHRRAVLGAARDRAPPAGRRAGPGMSGRPSGAGASSSAEPGAADDLTILGRTVRSPVAHVECFPAPNGCTIVRIRTEEVASLCPVTGQPDLSSVVIEYEPAASCVESKSLKLYLWGFRDRQVFAEALAVAIA